MLRLTVPFALALLISVTGIGTFLVLAVLGLGAVAALATLARP